MHTQPYTLLSQVGNPFLPEKDPSISTQIHGGTPRGQLRVGGCSWQGEACCSRVLQDAAQQAVCCCRDHNRVTHLTPPKKLSGL